MPLEHRPVATTKAMQRSHVVEDSARGADGLPTAAQSLRIVHFNTNPDWGGGEQQILDLICGSVARGVHSTIIAHPRGALFERCGKHSKCTRIAFRPRRNPIQIARLCRILKLCCADFLHLHDSKAIAIGVAAATLLNQPTILHRRISSAIRRNPISSWLYRARCIAGYIAVSDAARQALLNAAIPIGKISVIPGGVDMQKLTQPTDRQSLRAQLGLDDGTWIGTVGSLDRKKDTETLLRAAAVLAPTHPDWRYLIVGGGREYESLVALARQLGIAGQVKFTNCVSDAWRYTSVLDAFVFPSLREGSPGAVKEAMALRVPVIAADSPGTDEVILPATGVLIAKKNPQALAQALDGVLTSPEATEEMVERAHARVAATYSIGQTVDATIALYQKLRCL